MCRSAAPMSEWRSPSEMTSLDAVVVSSDVDIGREARRVEEVAPAATNPVLRDRVAGWRSVSDSANAARSRLAGYRALIAHGTVAVVAGAAL